LVWIEDESRTVGKVHLPEVMFDAMQRAQQHQLDVDIDTRVQNLVRDYGSFPKQELCDALSVIKQKLGGERYQHAMQAVMSDDLPTAVRLILDYYDRTYEYCQRQRTT
jgi:tRNA 2-selenouridine synthase